jgi:N-acetylmuramate 1-kinase
MPDPISPTDVPAIEWPHPTRRQAFEAWLQRQAVAFGVLPQSVRPASADASFRRYFRVDRSTPQGLRTLVVMDAPPDKENCRPFVQVAALCRQAGVRVPEVLDWDEPQGFMLLSDLGDHTLLTALDPGQPSAALPWFKDATQTLLTWQQTSVPGVLPVYDAALLQRELQLFPDWYLTQHKGRAPTEAMQATLAKTFELIVARNLAAPMVFVHRDFMPRNLMLPREGDPDRRLGVLDFQDAVYGPITYDIACLMRDAFLTWEEDVVLDVTVRYWEQARKVGLMDFEGWSERLRGLLPCGGMDGLAAPSEGGRHLCPADPARRQAQVPGRRAALHPLHPQHGGALPGTDPAAAPDRRSGGLAGGHRLCLRAQLKPAVKAPPGHAPHTPPRPRCSRSGRGPHARGRAPRPGAAPAARRWPDPVWRPAVGRRVDARVLRMGRQSVEVEVESHRPIEREPAREVHLAMGMPANDRMDWLVEKTTELGVASLQPLMTERSVLRLQGERADKKRAHWQAVAVSACEQCGGNRVPLVHPVQTLDAWLRLTAAPAHRAVLSLAPGSQPLAQWAAALPQGQPLQLLHGPEGGLSPAEENALLAAGWSPVSLGPRVLRAETAAVAALALLALGA